VIKSRAANGAASVTFTLDPRVGGQTAAVCGDWNDWSADTDIMHRDAEGGFSLTIRLQAGRAYRFRYLLDGERWDNDWAADAYVANSFGGDDSVVDLTELAEPSPPSATKAPAKKEPAKAPAKKEPAKAPAKKETAKAPAKKETAKAPAKKETAKAPAKKEEPPKAPAAKEEPPKAAPARATSRPVAPATRSVKKTTK